MSCDSNQRFSFKEALSFNGITLNASKGDVSNTIRDNFLFKEILQDTPNLIVAKTSIIANHHRGFGNISIDGLCSVSFNEGKSYRIEFKENYSSEDDFYSLCDLYESKYGKCKNITKSYKDWYENTYMWEDSQQRISITRHYRYNLYVELEEYITITYEDLVYEKKLKETMDSLNYIRIKQKQQEQDSLKRIMELQSI